MGSHDVYAMLDAAARQRAPLSTEQHSTAKPAPLGRNTINVRRTTATKTTTTTTTTPVTTHPRPLGGGPRPLGGGPLPRGGGPRGGGLRIEADESIHTHVNVAHSRSIQLP